MEIYFISQVVIWLFYLFCCSNVQKFWPPESVLVGFCVLLIYPHHWGLLLLLLLFVSLACLIACFLLGSTKCSRLILYISFLVLQSAISSRALIPCRRMVLVTNIWALVMLIFCIIFQFLKYNLRTLISEINWSQKDKYCTLSLMWGI